MLYGSGTQVVEKRILCSANAFDRCGICSYNFKPIQTMLKYDTRMSPVFYIQLRPG